jgi:hypothetical protein
VLAVAVAVEETEYYFCWQQKIRFAEILGQLNEIKANPNSVYVILAF